jgi:hypothetical protein
MNPLSLAIPLGLLGPALAVSAFAYVWRGVLPHFWWFVGIGGVASYVLMAVCFTWALSDIGITGNLSVTPRRALDPIAIRYLSFMLLWLVGTAIILFLARYLLSKI